MPQSLKVFAEFGKEREDRVYLTYFNAGLRIYDLADPVRPFEIAHYIPDDPKQRLGMLPKTLVTQSEDVLVDRRGFMYVTDKNHGLHIPRGTVCRLSPLRASVASRPWRSSRPHFPPSRQA